MTEMLALAPLPSSETFESPYYHQFPRLVRVFDDIRFELDGRLDADDFAEFTWFAREYPRCYRHHLSACAFRLRNIHARYQQAHAWCAQELRRANPETFISS